MLWCSRLGRGELSQGLAENSEPAEFNFVINHVYNFELVASLKVFYLAYIYIARQIIN